MLALKHFGFVRRGRWRVYHYGSVARSFMAVYIGVQAMVVIKLPEFDAILYPT